MNDPSDVRMHPPSHTLSDLMEMLRTYVNSVWVVPERMYMIKVECMAFVTAIFPFAVQVHQVARSTSRMLVEVETCERNLKKVHRTTTH